MCVLAVVECALLCMHTQLYRCVGAINRCICICMHLCVYLCVLLVFMYVLSVWIAHCMGSPLGDVMLCAELRKEKCR